MGDPKNPVPGDLVIDASGVAVIDYTTEHLNTLTKLRDGHEKAVANLARLTAEQLKAAGLNAEEVAAIVDLAVDHRKIGVLLAASEKMTELLHESHLDRGHKIATRLAEATSQARRRADRSPLGAAILGPLEDLLEYQLAPAQKGVITKAKKAKAPPPKAPPPKDGSTAPAGPATTP